MSPYGRFFDLNFAETITGTLPATSKAALRLQKTGLEYAVDGHQPPRP
jgi:hypothetical protein